MDKWYLHIVGYNDLPENARGGFMCKNSAVIIRSKLKYAGNLDGAEVYEAPTNKWHPVTQNVSRFKVLFIGGDPVSMIKDIEKAMANLDN